MNMVGGGVVLSGPNFQLLVQGFIGGEVFGVRGSHDVVGVEGY
jgi:hypothetical protein